MLYIIPVANSDKAHIEFFVKSLMSFPPFQGDKVLIVPTPEAAADPKIASSIDMIRSVFGTGNTTIWKTPNTPQGGWPEAANTHFMWAVSQVAEMEQSVGLLEFMWLETDCTFVRHRWSEILQTDYRACEKPFYGVEVDTVLIYDEGTRNERVVTEGVHMMGVGIYPGRYSVIGRGWKFPQKDKSFTIFCQKEHENFARTRLIEHRARTCNWRIVDDQIVCDDAPKHKHAIRYGGVVDLSQALIVHGCKDGSLQKLVSERTDLFQGSVAAVSAKVGSDTQLESLMQENEFLRLEVQRLQVELSDVKARASSLMSQGPLPVLQSTERVVILPSAEAVKNALKTGNMRLKEMAEFFSVEDVDQFESHLKTIGYHAPKPGRYVSPFVIESKPTKKASKKRAA